jgi:hypothetical protein
MGSYFTDVIASPAMRDKLREAISLAIAILNQWIASSLLSDSAERHDLSSPTSLVAGSQWRGEMTSYETINLNRKRVHNGGSRKRKDPLD